MREKLKKLRQKVHKCKPVKTGNFVWTYPIHHAKRRRASVDVSLNSTKISLSPLSKEKEKEYKEKSLSLRPPQTVRKVKRVPPPNFMIGMRDLSRVYDEDAKVLIVPKRVLSSSP